MSEDFLLSKPVTLVRKQSGWVATSACSAPIPDGRVLVKLDEDGRVARVMVDPTASITEPPSVQELWDNHNLLAAWCSEGVLYAYAETPLAQALDAFLSV